MEVVKFSVHYGLHFVFPAIIAIVFFKDQWKKAYVVMLVTMLIDLDHLLANPIFDPERCSINFHPLHTYYMFIIYVGLLFFKKTRVVGIGLTLHLIADFIDCLF
ncbi:DUF6122 family protein [Flavobacteriaceae bacterium S356]|uniref:DUF6122 family protein n=1 Tax=Asprobacillus argus TaxID=3076534 RepID=A0ABU3LHZ4_9FLAO|nr:DUF6122 family protein [Flavobacteriaceae bacterium S356]